jgi:hypothetical protein
MRFEKTELGRRAFQSREIKLTPCQRAIFITITQERTRADLLQTAISMGGSALDLEVLLNHGMIEIVGGDSGFGVTEDPSLGSSSVDEIEDNLWSDPLRPTAAEGPDSISAEPITDRRTGPASGFGSNLTPAERFTRCKIKILSLLEPLGLRAIQLRRTVEAASNQAQLSDLAPMVREALSAKDRVILDEVLAAAG